MAQIHPNFRIQCTFLIHPIDFMQMIMEIPSFRKLLDGEDQDSEIREGSLGKKVVDLVRRFWGIDEKVFIDGVEETIFRLENEDCGRVKLEQMNIGRRDRGDLKVRVLMENGEEDVVVIRGGVKTTEEDISKVLRKLDSTKNLGFTLDFTGMEEDNVCNFNNLSLGDMTEKNNFTDILQQEGQDVRLMTHTYSTWHHFPDNEANISKSSANLLSDEEILKSELEWKKSNLLKQLEDPHITRDIDDLQNELKEVKKELNKLSGWRRFFSFGS